MRLPCAALGVLVALSVTTACGGSKSLSKEQYASRLSAMCEDFSKREQAIGDPQSVEDLVEKGPRVVEAFEQAIVEPVHELKAPDEISDQASRLTDLADQQRDVLVGLVAAAKRSDFEAVNELASKNATLNRESSSIAKELGATSCANDQG
ncbi:MAG: hypothetical protein AABM30_00095 [Actinomycetota bacterium]